MKGENVIEMKFFNLLINLTNEKTLISAKRKAKQSK